MPEGATLAQFALRWILDFDAVSAVIPGAKTPEQARANAAASRLSPLSEELHAAIADVYRRRIAPQVEHRVVAHEAGRHATHTTLARAIDSCYIRRPSR